MLALEECLRQHANAAGFMATSGVDSVVDTVIQGTLQVVEELQREQLFAGIREDGTMIRPSYAASTIRRKERRNPPQPTNRVTLKDKGFFHAGVRATYNRSGQFIEVTSIDVKTQFLEARYSSNIFGLSDDYLDLYIDLIAPDIVQGMTQTYVRK